MKIAYVFQADGRSFERPYAPNIHILNIVRSLQKRGHEVKLVTLYRSREVVCTANLEAILNGQLKSSHDLAQLHTTDHPIFKAGESAIRRTQTIVGFPYLAIFESMRIYEACVRHLSDVDVIHERYKMQAIGGSLAAKKLRIPIVLEVNGDSMDEWTLRGQPVTGLRKQYAMWATRTAYHGANQVISVSNDLRDHLVNRWQLDRSRIHVLPNGADIEKFGRPSAPEATLARFGLCGSPIIIVVGGFFEWYDFDLLLQSFKLVRTHSPDALLVLVGEGDTYAAVKNKAKVMELQDSVCFTGQIPHECIPNLLAVSDVAIVPMRGGMAGYGASPMKLYEYMAAGKAIIASRTGQNAEVIKHKQTGLLYDPDDVGSLLKALTTLLDNPELRQQFGTNAQQDAIKKHSWDSYAEKLERIYENAIQQAS